jgi:MFS family permease
VRSVLDSPQLRRIIAAYGINRLGTWFGTVALSLAVFDHTHSSIAVAATLVAGQVVPAFAVPSVVARVEASRRQRELSWLYFVEAVATTAIGLLLWSFWLPGLLLLVAIDGTAALAANALLRTEAARVARQELDSGDDPHAAEQQANAAINVVFSGTFVLGPALAGIVVAAAGATSALFIDAGSFLICGVLLLDLHPHVDAAGGESVSARLRAAWEHIRDVPALRALLFAQAVGLVFFESAVPIEVAYIKRTLAAGDRGYGLLVTAWGIGVVLGSVIFARAGNRRLGLMMSLGTFAIGAAYLGFAAAPSLLVAMAAALVGGVGNGIQYAPVISSLQRLTPTELHGRVMGMLESISAICPAIGLALGGVLVAVSSPRTAFIVVGIGAVLTTVAFARVHVDSVSEPEQASAEIPVEPEADGAIVAQTSLGAQIPS